MVSTTKRSGSWRNGIMVLAAAVALPFAANAVKGFLSLDPFAQYRSSGQTEKPTVGVELNDVSMRHYRKGNLVTSAIAKQVQISDSRNEIRLRDVSDGVFNSEQGPIKFVAQAAYLNPRRKSVDVVGDAHIRHKDFDLTTTQVQFADKTSVLETTKAITGKLYGGDVEAVGFRYNTAKKTFVVGKTKWTGALALDLGQGDGKTPKKWNLDGEKTTNDPVTNTITTMNGRGADNEVILLADKIVWQRKPDIVTATGNVRYFSSEANLSAAKVVIYRKEKRAVLTDSVRVLVKPETEQGLPPKEEALPDFKLLVADDVLPTVKTVPKTPEEKQKIEELRSNESARRYPTKIAADKVEYWYGKGNRHAIITGNPQARQDFVTGMWRHVWTDHALYDGEKDLLTLISGEKDLARMKNSYGDDGTAKTFVLSTKKDDEAFTGTSMKGVYVSEEEEEESEAATKEKTPPPTKAGESAPRRG